MATWNTDKPAVGNQITADIADIEENLQELHDVIAAITSGTLGTTEPAAFTVDSLADGTTGFASTTTQPFYQNSAPTGWTRNSALTDNSMFMYAAAGNVATGGAGDAKAAHTHTGPSHTHTGPSHTHTGGSHTLATTEIPAHTHTVPTQVVVGAAYAVVAATQGNGTVVASPLTGSTGGGGSHSHGATSASGTGATAAGGTGATGSNTAPYYIEMILAAVD